MEMMETLMEPWPWYVAGPLIAVVMASMYLLGFSFGISSTMRTICAACGAGRIADFFRFNWKEQTWNLLFVAGMMIGGAIGAIALSDDERPVAIHPDVKKSLVDYGMEAPGAQFQPVDIFSWDNLFTAQGLIFMVLGGFLVGFGTRYAGGCTSGHAIAGLSALQLPSLVAVIGFFAGGLLVTWFVLPEILAL
jgi:hypothetical protein